jgi:hypothetical protein
MAEFELKDGYKELWVEYQNGESAAIADLTYDQLNERIAKWEAIEFEARAKRQKCLADKRTRDEAKKKAGRDALINDPHYSPKDSPSSLAENKDSNYLKQPKVRLSKEEKLKGSLGELGVDLGELLAAAKMKKTAKLVTPEVKEGE